MRRALRTFILILSLCVLAGCSDAPAKMSSEEIPTDAPTESGIEDTEPPYVPSMPEDTSTGRSEPRIVDTVYPTDDIVIADIIPTDDGYAVSGEGAGDSTFGIQKALNDCARNGGGTVYLPAGDYVIKSRLTIPPYVTLRGDWQDPDEGNDYGTVIHIACASSDNSRRGTITLGGSGGIVGLTFYYPEQSIDNVKPYPFTIFTDGKAGERYMLSTVKNVTVINGYRGIGACTAKVDGIYPAHEQLSIENFKGTFLHTAAEVYNQADVGTWQDISVSNKYWADASERFKCSDGEALRDYTKKNTVGLTLGDLEWTEFVGLGISDCKTGIQIVNGKRIEFAGSLLDVEIKDCEVGIKLDALDIRWGMLLAHAEIDGGIVNNTDGLVKLCDVKVNGITKGNIELDDSAAAMPVPDTKKAYRKPTPHLFVLDADKTGAIDATSAIQSLLDEAGATGGVVYIPGGVYRVDGRLNVPEGVELRGASSVAVRDELDAKGGTVLLCRYGDGAEFDAERDRAFITLDKHAGLNGLRIVYPDNGPYDRTYNTTYTVRARAEGVYAVNTCIVASAYGIDFRDCDGHFVKKVITCCYFNAFRLGGSGGYLSGCLQNGTVITRCRVSESPTWLTREELIWQDLFDPTLRRECRYIILECAEGETVYNTFAYGCANFLICEGSTVKAFNIGADNLGAECAQIVMNGGALTVVNAMRYNGYSFDHVKGRLEIYNRLTIEDKSEKTYIDIKN